MQYQWNRQAKEHIALLGKEAPLLVQGTITCRDLNKNGVLDPYENPQASIEIRVEDLLQQMNIKEKKIVKPYFNLNMLKDY